jgi:penicillin-binding protein-related factor A (putative recombinase)
MSAGKDFEQQIEDSCKHYDIFNFRVRDVNPMLLKKGSQVPKNRFDYLLYYDYHLFPCELKSTQSKSVSFSESIIKEYQIKNLTEAATYKGIISGFIFNFRKYDNQTFFVHINEFNKYKEIVENNLEHTYESKTNEASIPLDVCKEIGFKIPNEILRTRYRYSMDKLFERLIDHYG